MSSYYLSHIRLALARLRSKLSLDRWVDRIESRCSYWEGGDDNLSYPCDSKPCVYAALWYKGEHLGSYNEYDGSHGRKEVVRQWLKRQLIGNAAWSIVFTAVIIWTVLSFL